MVSIAGNNPWIFRAWFIIQWVKIILQLQNIWITGLNRRFGGSGFRTYFRDFRMSDAAGQTQFLRVMGNCRRDTSTLEVYHKLGMPTISDFIGVVNTSFKGNPPQHPNINLRSINIHEIWKWVWNRKLLVIRVTRPAISFNLSSISIL